MYNEVLQAAEMEGVDLNGIDVAGVAAAAELEAAEIEAIRRRFTSPAGQQKAIQTAQAAKVRGAVRALKSPGAAIRMAARNGDRPLTFEEQLILSQLEKVNKQLFDDFKAGKAIIRSQRHYVRDWLLPTQNIHKLQENLQATKVGLSSLANRTIPQNSAFAFTHVAVFIGIAADGTKDADVALANWNQNIYPAQPVTNPLLTSLLVPNAIHSGVLQIGKQQTTIIDLPLSGFFAHTPIPGNPGGELAVKMATPELFNAGDQIITQIRNADGIGVPTTVSVAGVDTPVRFAASVEYIGIEIVRR